MNVNLSREKRTVHADCRHCALRGSVLFAGLRERDFEQIRNLVISYTLLPGERLYRSGDEGERVFTVRRGVVKFVQYLPDGTQRIVRILHRSDVAGLEALLSQPYQHDALVLQAAEVCSFPANVVQKLALTNSALYQELLLRWQQALADADTWLLELSTGTARQRVARLLLQQAQFNENGCCTLLSCEDMGAILSITTETASRIIAEFKRQKFLINTDINTFMLDQAKLKEIANCAH